MNPEIELIFKAKGHSETMSYYELKRFFIMQNVQSAITLMQCSLQDFKAISTDKQAIAIREKMIENINLLYLFAEELYQQNKQLSNGKI